MMKRKYFKKLIRMSCIIILALFCVNCNSEKKSNIIYIYSKDKSQIVSIISDYSKSERVIAIGKHAIKPKTDYYKLNISNITNLGDEVGVCWKINGNGWEIVNDKAKIVEVNIDTTKYVFRENWFSDKIGIPNAKYYRKSNCFTFRTLNYGEHYPKENGYLERFR